LTPELWNILGAVVAGLVGGVLVEIVRGHFNRDKVDAEIDKLRAETKQIRADEKIELQKLWHAEINRLENEVERLRADIQCKDEENIEITQKYQKLKQDYQDLEKKVKKQDELILRVSERIEELEALMRNNGIDPNGGGE
jgi:predicted RNase H-like nuclease (RuvC/YqgF family)